MEPGRAATDAALAGHDRLGSKFRPEDVPALATLGDSSSGVAAATPQTYTAT